MEQSLQEGIWADENVTAPLSPRLTERGLLGAERSTAGFPDSHAIKVMTQVVLGWGKGCPAHLRTCHSIPGLRPLVTCQGSKRVSGHCQTPPGEASLVERLVFITAQFSPRPSPLQWSFPPGTLCSSGSASLITRSVSLDSTFSLF